MASDSARTALEIADWRRRVFALYDAVRAQDDPEDAHELWRIERDDLMARHPATPLLEPDRLLFEGLTIAPYDAAWWYELPILPADPGGFEFATATDGIVPFERVGLVEIPDAGTLDVWRLTTYAGGLFVPVRDALAGQIGGTYGGGRYLIDTPSLETLFPRFRERNWFQVGDVVVLQEQRYVMETGHVETEWIFVRDGVAAESYLTSMRVYGVHELSALLREAGFDEIELRDDELFDFEVGSQRLWLVATKP